jgi:hypothetical protein
MRRLVWALCLSLLVPSAASAQPAVIPTQSTNSKNQEVTSGSAAAVSVTLTPSTQTRAKLYSVAARCSAGTAQLTVSDGGTQRWSSDTTFIGTTTKSLAWIPPLTGGVGSAVVVTLGTCGGGNTGVLDVQADIF